jgi:hypothetical protein
MAGTGNSSVRSYNYFVNGSIQGTGTYAENDLAFIDVDDQTPFVSHSILIVNDGATSLSFRFSPDEGGGAAHGIVKTTEQLQLDFKRARRIYLSGTAALAFRLWAW